MVKTVSERSYHTGPIPPGSLVLGADVGGTNTNIGLFVLTPQGPLLISSVHYKSREVENFGALFRDAVARLKITDRPVDSLCIAAAGVISSDRLYTKPTNLSVTIHLQEIERATGIKKLFLTNDFEVIGYGILSMDNGDLVRVKEGTVRKKANQAILGAGTGLGKCIMKWEEDKQLYTPSASEGGHADFAAQTELDQKLIQFLKQESKSKFPVSWEDILSGDGISKLYKFFQLQCEGRCDADGPHPDEIFASRHLNEAALKTFHYYRAMYARCAKNFALDALALSGIFIAGGIAAKNLPLFQASEFITEFINCRKQGSLLEQIPVSVITDYNVSLYGAARYIMLEAKKRSNF